MTSNSKTETDYAEARKVKRAWEVGDASVLQSYIDPAREYSRALLFLKGFEAGQIDFCEELSDLMVNNQDDDDLELLRKIVKWLDSKNPLIVKPITGDTHAQ